jgi:nitrate/nitrite transporter NarK
VLSQFLGLFGFFFVGLQYLQLILGYSELKAALAMVPVAVVILPMSNLTPSIVDRLGRRNVVSLGLILLAAAFYIVTQMDAGSGYMPFLIALLIGGLGLAFASTPSTTAITESLPRSKQGVASAINDTTREVGAALGIAIVGSIYASGYEGKVGEITGQLPPEAAHMVENSAAAGLQVAAQAGAQGPALADAVKDAFMTGLSDSMMVVVVILVVSAVVSWFMSPRQAVVHEEEGAAELAPESTPAV